MEEDVEAGEDARRKRDGLRAERNRHSDRGHPIIDPATEFLKGREGSAREEIAGGEEVSKVGKFISRLQISILEGKIKSETRGERYTNNNGGKKLDESSVKVSSLGRKEGA